MTREAKAWSCIHCGKLFDAYTALAEDKDPPKPGDIMLCIDCGAIYIRRENGESTEPTLKELVELKGRREWLILQEARNLIRSKR